MIEQNKSQNLTVDEIYKYFLEMLKNKNKKKAVHYIYSLLQKEEINLKTLYSDILSRSLQDIASNQHEQQIPIWEEHYRTQVVRTILELSYLKAIQKGESEPSSLKSIVFCLEEEYHELGARIATDYLLSLGIDAEFIGANTPRREALDAISYFKPDWICISVTNHFHLHKLSDFIQEVQLLYPLNGINQATIIVGGYAINHSSQVKSQVPADFFVSTLDDLEKIKELHDETSL